jgi:hypothetical protein
VCTSRIAHFGYNPTALLPPPALEGIRRLTDDPALEALLRFAAIYPIDDDKSPKVMSIAVEATKDIAIIRRWESDSNAFGLSIDDGSDVFVFDVESVAKGKGDGEAVLDALERQHGGLPIGPATRTKSGGRHLYFRSAEKYRGQIHNWNKVLPAIDVKTGGGVTFVPPTAGYSWIRSPAEYAIPLAPDYLVEAILERYGGSSRSVGIQENRPVRRTRTARRSAFRGKAEPYSDKEWYRLYRSRGFKSVWHRRAAMPHDPTNSALELSLANRALARGFTPGQVVTLIRVWWRMFELTEKEDRLRTDIIPAAQAATKAYVNTYRAERQRRQDVKARNRIIRLADEVEEFTIRACRKSL